MTMIEELRRLHEAATPGPWIENLPGDVWHTRGPGGPLAPFVEHNARLIVAMRNALPALLDVAEAAREHAEACRNEGDGGMNTVPTTLLAALARLDGAR